MDRLAFVWEPAISPDRRDFADGSAVVRDPVSGGWYARTPRGWLCLEDGGLVVKRLFTRAAAVAALRERGYGEGASDAG